MSAAERPRVLCVDDEPSLLEGLRLILSRRYRVQTAASGADAVALLERDAGFAVIISDMRMPGVSGAEFLARACTLAPQAQRIALTGQSDLASAIHAINEGQIFRYLSKPCPPPELLAAVQAAVDRRRSEALARSALRLRVEQRQLRIDPITGLGSRLQALETLETLAADGSVTDLIACHLDVERPGGAALDHDVAWAEHWPRVIAERLRHRAAQATLIARWDVEQFVMLLAVGVGDLNLQVWADELCDAVAAPIAHGGHAWPVDVSVGIARRSDRGRWQELIECAGLAALEARRKLGSRVCIYRAEVPLQSQREIAVMRALPGAELRGEISLHYQPIVDLSDGRVHALECLARWTHPDLGSVSPGEFIPLAEQNGHIGALGQWLLERACGEGRGVVGSRPLRLAVNVSAKQFIAEGFVHRVMQCLLQTRLPPECLELELTESVLVADLEHLRDVLQRLRRCRVRLAIDDFGTGQSSLSYLSRLPIDVIKVDCAFVRDFDAGGRSVIKAALAMAQDFGHQVVIEGVESAAMLQRIRALGATLVQGYLFSRPQPAAKMQEWLRGFEASGLAPYSIDAARLAAEERA